MPPMAKNAMSQITTPSANRPSVIRFHSLAFFEAFCAPCASPAFRAPLTLIENTSATIAVPSAGIV